MQGERARPLPAVDYTDSRLTAAQLGLNHILYCANSLEFEALEDLKRGGDPAPFLPNPVLVEHAKQFAARQARAGLSRAGRRWRSPSRYSPLPASVLLLLD